MAHPVAQRISGKSTRKLGYRSIKTIANHSPICASIDEELQAQLAAVVRALGKMQSAWVSVNSLEVDVSSFSSLPNLPQSKVDKILVHCKLGQCCKGGGIAFQPRAFDDFPTRFELYVT